MIRTSEFPPWNSSTAWTEPAHGKEFAATEQYLSDINPQAVNIKKETWSQVVQKSIDTEKQKKLSNDRCLLEH